MHSSKRTKNTRAKSPNPWVAAGTLAACAVTGIGPGALLRAQNPADQLAGNVETTLPVVRLSISEGVLGDVLKEFERATGWRVEIPDPKMANLQSKGASGPMTAAQALRHILGGTGVTYRTVNPGRVVLEFPTVRSSVEVSERMPLPSPRYTEPLRDIPQTITVIPKDVIEQQAATSLTDVLRNVPGLTITAGEGGVPAGDNLTLRGNSARNDIFVDGVRDLSPQSRDPFNLEQVEVTKGPTSAITGRGSAGGAINLISKSPGISRSHRRIVCIRQCRHEARHCRLQLLACASGDGRANSFRLNGLFHDSGVAGRNAVGIQRWGSLLRWHSVSAPPPA